MFKQFFVSACLILFFSIGASAQLANATAVVGNVTDSGGGAVINAKVTAVETGTQDTYTMTTNDQGYFIQFGSKLFF